MRPIVAAPLRGVLGLVVLHLVPPPGVMVLHLVPAAQCRGSAFGGTISSMRGPWNLLHVARPLRGAHPLNNILGLL
jgi:hypothetical protein